jgi:hypothetical protein
VRRLPALLLAAAALVGCGGGHGAGGVARGTAALWITRDEGAHVILVTRVVAGQTAIRALERAVSVKTTYGGRYVQAIRGISGSLSAGRDWFYFVNGIAPDRGAADYVLHPGDVEWWDYRSWKGKPDVPVVVGAFPEPFVHGFGGKVRPAVVLGPGAAKLARLLHARVAATAPRGANVFRIVAGRARFSARVRDGGGVEFDYAGDPAALARDPGRYRFRYEVGSP